RRCLRRKQKSGDASNCAQLMDEPCDCAGLPGTAYTGSLHTALPRGHRSDCHEPSHLTRRHQVSFGSTCRRQPSIRLLRQHERGTLRCPIQRPAPLEGSGTEKCLSQRQPIEGVIWSCRRRSSAAINDIKVGVTMLRARSRLTGPLPPAYIPGMPLSLPL